MNKEDREG